MCAVRLRSRRSVGFFSVLATTLLAPFTVSPLAADDATEVPLKRVILFNAGVGYFEHLGEVDGDAHVDLKFNVDDINDLLQSLVLQDLGGGLISTVTYGSKEPLDRTLQTFAIDLTQEPTLADLLRQIRGERVLIEQPERLEGVIVGVERRPEPAGRDESMVEIDVLNLLTDEGLASVPLHNVRRIKLANDKLDAELRQALAVLALGHASDKKTVGLRFTGQGRRTVRIGYIQESPIWKTSYRLVLDEKQPPFLQGWAIVENATEEDWNEVGLTLISGRPITFRMDLYQSLYVARPMVPLDLFGAVQPQVYDQDLARADAAFRKMAAKQRPPGMAVGGGMGGMGGMAMGGRTTAADEGGGEAPLVVSVVPNEKAAPFKPGQGVASAASTADVGELFQYAIRSPVTLNRQQSAMLPIVNESVKGEKLAIYDPKVHSKHPLDGLRLANTTGLHLMQGPITVFDGGVFAGNARIHDLAPDGERLISYALDLDTEVTAEPDALGERLVAVRIAEGVVQTEHKSRRTQKYTIRNSGRREKKLLIEYPRDYEWTLVAPEKPAEQTRDRYRFAVAAEPGKPAMLSVVEERIDRRKVAIKELDDRVVQAYLDAKQVSAEVKAALAKIVAQKQSIARTEGQRALLEKQLAAIEREQSRIRENMARLDRNSDLYNRYVKKFGEQEDEIDKLRSQVKSLSEQESTQRQLLAELVENLTVE